MVDIRTSPRGVIASRLGATALAGGGALFALYQALRPFHDTAATMSSAAWLVSHLAAIGGFTLVALGLATLPWLEAFAGGVSASGGGNRSGGGLGATAVAATWLGAGLTLPYYGAETFGLWVIARRSLDTGDPGLLRLVDEFHSMTVAVVAFAVGLLLMAAGTVLAAVAVARSGRLAWHRGVVLAAAYLLLIPQFYTPQPVRIVHGLVLLAGAVWLAIGFLRWPGRVA